MVYGNGLPVQPMSGILSKVTNIWPLESMGVQTPEWTAAHELAHSMVFHPSEGYEARKQEDINHAYLLWSVGDVPFSLLDYPLATSPYQRANSEERRAEIIAAVLNGSFPHPDEARRFLSPANKEYIQAFLALEKKHPGLPNYLVSISDLMDRTSAHIGK